MTTKLFTFLYSLVAACVLLSLGSCGSKGLPLAHSPNCQFKTPEALAQSLALAIRDADFECANGYLPGMGAVLGIESTNTDDADAQQFGQKADHILVKALKEEITKLRTQVTEKGGDLTKLKLLEVTQNDREAVLQITLHLKASKQAFTVKPVGLFQSEGNWYILGAKLHTNL